MCYIIIFFFSITANTSQMIMRQKIIVLIVFNTPSVITYLFKTREETTQNSLS